MLNRLGGLAHGPSDFFFVFFFFNLGEGGNGEKRVRRKQVCDWLAQSLFQSQCCCLSS